MSGASDVIYLYDGTLDGMLCCFWEAFLQKEMPSDIWQFEDEQPTLYRLREIVTDETKAQRVHDGICRRLGDLAEDWVLDAYYSALPHKELAALDFLKFGFAKGPGASSMLGHPQVAPLFAASRALHNESHLLKGFIRFSDYDGILVSQIEPKNYVLPFLSSHFCARFPHENFMIYDKTHRCALVHSGTECRIVEADNLVLPSAVPQEAEFRALWKQFYDTIEIQPRHNPRCRMTHVPKRYWHCMTELAPELALLPVSVRQALQSGELQLPNTVSAQPKGLAEAAKADTVIPFVKGT